MDGQSDVTDGVMLKQRAQAFLGLMGVCDALAVAGAWGGAFFLRFSFFPSEKGVPPAPVVATNLLVVLLLSLVVLSAVGLYKPRRDKSFLQELGLILKASCVVWAVLIVVIYFTAPGPFTRGMLALFLPLMMAALVLERGAYRSVLRGLRRKGWNLRHALIVGTGRLGQAIYLQLQRNSWTGIRVTGFVAAAGESGGVGAMASVRGVPVVGMTEQLGELVQRSGVDCVFVALPWDRGAMLGRVIRELEQTAVDVRIVPDMYLSRFPARVGVSELDGMPILSLRENPLRGWPTVYKRIFDIGGALFGLLVFGVPMLLIAGAIRLQDGGPVLYRQRRVSFGRRAFFMLKFRTMAADAERGGPQFTARNDPRCTRLGRYLRALSLDELPQLFNVILGDMSLVGPRPERPEMLEKIEREVPGFPMRLQVRAGLTGWAQVHGFRGGNGRTSFRKRLQYDLYYLNHWTPLLDVRIVLATIVRGFRHPNAY